MKIGIKKIALHSVVILSVVLTGCAATAPITHQPMSARPEIPLEYKEPVRTAGSLYSEKSYQSMYETKKPKKIGDVLIIAIQERNSALSRSGTNVSKEGTISAQVESMNKLPFSGLVGLGMESNSTQEFAGSGDTNINNQFNGSITVTVIDVYPNGNLLVSGEKQMLINQGKEFVRFSGVVNPEFINNYQVSSSQVADARLEYSQGGVIGSAQVMGLLARFFLSVLPL